MKNALFHIIICLHFVFNCFSQPGKNGSYTVASGVQVLNRYSPVSVDISVNSTSLVIAQGASFAVCPGDLIMVYQAQGALMDITNTNSYGNILNYNSAGLYEFAYVQSVSGNTINVQSAFTNSYSSLGKTQVIKVPQYSTLTVNNGTSVLAKAWKDTVISSVAYRFGGLVVIHASQIVNNGIISSSGSGFRGGAVFYLGNIYLGNTAFRSTINTQGAEKGEGIFGYQVDYDNNNGRYCMGAPANGGGGGDGHNAGGGGGANGNNGNAWTGQGVMIVNASNLLAAWALSAGYMANGNTLTTSSGGGHGGYSHGNANGNALTQGPGNTAWSGDNRREVGGVGGRPLGNINSETRIYFGGGGGAPHADNNATGSGANGGGIVYLFCGNGISGTGTITSDGYTANNSTGCNCDGGAGGGAGGSIVIKTGNISATQLVTTNGGNGGNQLLPGNPNESEGPGGGGGGGFVAISSSGVTPQINGGLNGTTLSNALANEMTANGATQGQVGQNGTVSTAFVSFIFPTISSFTLCAGSPLSLISPSVGNSYSWVGPNSFTSSAQNPSISSTATNMSGSYSITVSYTNGCTVQAATNVSIQPLPVIGSINVGSVACISLPNTGSANVNVSGGSGTYSYTWSGLSQNSPSVTGIPSGTYNIQVIDLNGLCSSSQTFQVLMAPGLTIAVNANTTSACIGISPILTATSSGGTPGYNYTWTAGPSTASYAANSGTAGTHIYTVNSTDFNNCPISNTISITFYNNPVLSVSSLTLCPNTVGTLSVGGASSYTWQTSGLSASTTTVSALQSTTYPVIGTSVNGCTSTTLASLFVKVTPTVSFNTYTINCGNLGSATVTANGALGPYNYSWSPTNQTGNIATGLFPGSYSVSVFDAGTGCTTNFTTTFLPLVPLTATVSNSYSMSCYGAASGTANISLSGGSGSQTYTWTDGQSIQTSSVAGNLTGGIYTVNVVDALTFCSVTKTFSIIQPNPIIPTINVSSPSVCLGGSINFTAVSGGGTPGYTFTWNPGPSAANHSVSSALSGSYIYSVSGNDANNCAFSKTVSVSFVPNPTISVANVSICPLQIASVTANGASSYSWNSGATGSVLVTSPLVSTVYSVVGTALSCTAANSATVFLKNPPTASIAASPTICQGQILTLNGSGGITYFWSGPQSYTSSLQNNSLTANNITNSGNYNLTVTAVNGCTNLAVFNLSVHPTPTISLQSPVVCENTTLNLNSNSLPGATYSWSGPGSFTSNLQNPSLAPSSLSMTGTYSLLLTSTQSCTNIASVSASVMAIPVISVLSNSVLCAGANLSLSASGANSYVWNGPNGFLSLQGTINISNITSNAAGAYSLSSIKLPCIVNSQVMVTVNALPIPTINSNSPVCDNKSIQLNGMGGVSYLWTGPSNYSSNQPTVIISPATFSNGGTYTLSVTDGNSCQATTITTVSVIPNPTPVVISATVCLGETATLSVSGGITYSWMGPFGFIANTPDISINTTGLVSGIYTVVVTAANSCSVTSLANLTINNLPLPVPLINAPSKTCIGSYASLTASGGTSYLWSGPNAFTSTNSIVTLGIPGIQAAGIYSVIVGDEFSCHATGTVAISVFPTPSALISANINSVCVPFCPIIKLKPSGNTGPILSSTYLAEGIMYKDSATHCFTKPGIYNTTFSFVDSNNCVGVANYLFTAYEKPNASFDFKPFTTISVGDEVQFYSTSTGNSQTQWNWYFYNNNNNSVQEKYTYFKFTEAGSFPVVLVVKNKWGCTDTIIRTVIVDEDISIYVPSAFTPNEDGANDSFQPKGVGILQYTLEIFDRWGELIYKTQDFSAAWDGMYRGQICPQDSYVWKIIATGRHKTPKTFTGIVNLIR